MFFHEVCCAKTSKLGGTVDGSDFLDVEKRGISEADG